MWDTLRRSLQAAKIDVSVAATESARIRAITKTYRKSSEGFTGRRIGRDKGKQRWRRWRRRRRRRRRCSDRQPTCGSCSECNVKMHKSEGFQDFFLLCGKFCDFSFSFSHSFLFATLLSAALFVLAAQRRVGRGRDWIHALSE